LLEKIAILVNLLSFTFVVSQPLFYLLALADAQKSLGASSYIELRNLLDRKLQVNLRLVYYITLFTNLLLIVLAILTSSTVLLFTSLIAMAALCTDLFFMFKRDIPVNKTIQTWTPESFPPDWNNYRSKWFFYYYRRQIADLTGFLSLIIGAVFS
jgi:hypothetical protein